MLDLAAFVIGLLVVLCVCLLLRTPNGRWCLLGVGIVAGFALLAGCKPTDTKVVQSTKTVEVKVPQYVAIPKDLTKPVPIPEGKLVDVIDVAKQRKVGLIQCNGQLEAIGAIQGTKPC